MVQKIQIGDRIMPERTSFSLDTKDFDIRCGHVTEKTMPEAAAKAVFQTGAMVIRDAILEEPRAPWKSGHLWREQKIEQPKIDHGEISVELGFDTPYAARLHEAPDNWNWTLPGSGPKYLEAKLIKNKEKYMANVAEKIRQAGGG